MESIKAFLQENEIAQFACSIAFVILFSLLFAWFLNGMFDMLAHSRAKSKIKMERAKQEEEFKRQLESERERRAEIIFNEKEKTYALRCTIQKGEGTIKEITDACNTAIPRLECLNRIIGNAKAICLSLEESTKAAEKLLEELKKQSTTSQEIVDRRDLYRNFSLRELSGMPDDTIIGEDGLPRIIGSRGWGEYYTRFKSYDGNRYHRAGCAHAFTRVHVFSHECPTIPCMSCLPEPLPDREWFDLYRLHYQEAKKVGASLKPDPLECALLNADISDLSGSKGG